MAQEVSSSINLEDILQARRTSNDFRWASRWWTPSPYFSRGGPKEIREICQLVLSSEAVVSAVKEVAKMEGKEEAEIQKRAQEVIQEMSHNFHLYAIRWFGLVLSKLGKRLYSNIYVNRDKVEELRNGFERYPVIFLPTHRSYVDFLLLSYVCFTYSLPLPIIAAGMDFMNMTGVAELLRKSGAFFIRRRFGNDMLYWAIISEYVKRTIMQGGHPMEFFIEGTRSRTGKSLSPKIGLLTQILEMVKNREIPDVLILPITMSYDRTLEETLYAHELLGQPKPKESTNGLLRALRWLGSQQYGSIYVNFGNFISVNSFLQMDRLSPVIDDRLFQKGVKDLSLHVIACHQEHIIVPLFSAVATVALSEISQGRKSITLPQLLSYVFGFQKLLQSKGLQFGCPLPGEPLEKNVLYLLTTVHQNLVTFAEVDQRLWFNLDTQESAQVITCMQLQHYSNQLVYLVVPFCLSALITSQNGRSLSVTAQEEASAMNQEHISQYTYLRTLLSEEFPCQKGVELMEIMFCTETWTVIQRQLQAQNSIPLVAGRRRDTNANLLTVEPEKLQECLKRAVAPSIIAYWGVASTLVQQQQDNPGLVLENKGFGKLCQNMLRQKLGSKLGQYYGALSLDAVNNAVMGLINAGVLAKAKIPESNAPAFTLQNVNAALQMRAKLGKLMAEFFILSKSESESSSSHTGSDFPFPKGLCLRSKL